MRLVLFPLALLMGAVTAARNWLFDIKVLKAVSVDCPVISIGNLTVGGNGKTPLTVMIACKLRELGYRPFIVTRGYGGSLRGPVQVVGNNSPSEVGDEPLLLLEKTGCPVVISRARAAGVEYALAQNLGNVALLDDGFQHRWLRRDLDLLCVSSGSGAELEKFVQGELLPMGRFRESRDRALSRAGAVVWVNRSSVSSDEQSVLRAEALLPAGLPSFQAGLEVDGIFSLESGAAANLSEVVAFSGIAQPEGFFRTLESMAIRVAGRCAFPDHHVFSRADLEQVRAVHPELPLVCTEKDATKLHSLDKAKIHVLRTHLNVQSSDSFFRMIVASIERKMNAVPREQSMRRLQAEATRVETPTVPS